jgi:RNA polymerase sigma-70 factor (TIGR02960 family)
VTTTELISRARAGDGEAFRELVEPHRRELQVHCYRMLGSLHDAEDALQEALLAAWHGFAGFEGRASLRTWLYRIATNRCLNVRRTAARRRASEGNVAGFDLPEATGRNEVTWLEPFPDALLPAEAGPEARYEQTEAISLAFVTALQTLPPRQVAVLVLRDVLGFPAAEVAQMLGSTVESVTSALKRARAGLQGVRPRAALSADETVARFVRAYESADIEGLVGLLTDDVFMTMPPLPFEYRGREVVGAFCARILASGRRFLVPARANGQPAFAVYAETPAGPRPGTGFLVLTLTGDRISGMTRFESSVFGSFGLPGTADPVGGGRYGRDHG